MINHNYLIVACISILLIDPPALGHAEVMPKQTIKILMIITGGYVVCHLNPAGLILYFASLFVMSYVCEVFGLENALVSKTDVGWSFILMSGVFIS